MKYRKKPVVIEAMQLSWGNLPELRKWLPANILNGENPFRVVSYSDTCRDNTFLEMTIPTLEGDHIARHGDYIIKGVQGEFYPCKPDIFKATYEPLE